MFVRKFISKDSNAKIIVSPSDHLVLKENKFEKTIHQALAFIEKNDVLLTMGIKPTRPDTGYGYIQHEEENENGIFKVKAFTEKPDLELAKTFIKSGDFLWNSGTFIWLSKAINAAIKKYLPEIYDAIETLEIVFSQKMKQKQ